MSIPPEEVARVRTATDLVALASERTTMKRVGRRHVGRCPFHAEKTPSFSVNAAEGLYYCFGCQASGDAITFVRALEGLDFAEAVDYLAARAGITIRHTDDAGEGGARRRERSGLLDAMEAATAWYHERLLTHADAGRARDYLRSRGYDGEVVRTFRLGWAPDAWDALVRTLDLDERVVTAAGLGFVNARGRMQDAFRARVLFPICDPAGHPIAFGGRILPGAGGSGAGGSGAGGSGAGAEGPKYKNTVETAIYAKRRTLYGLNWAKRAIVQADAAIVCEGYTDVIACAQSGLANAVATCGTALGDEHFAQLASFTKKVVLAFDADAAGQSAAERIYGWERRHELDISVARLPPGTDPAELGRSDPEALRDAIGGARPYVEFRISRALGAGDLATPEGRAKSARAAIDVVAAHPEALVRDQYAVYVADRCRMEAGRVRTEVERARRAGPAKVGTEATAGRAEAAAGHGSTDGHGGPPGRDARTVAGQATKLLGSPELEALLLAIQQPEKMAPHLDSVLFVTPRYRELFDTLCASTSLADAVERSDDEGATLLRRLSVEESEATPADVLARLTEVATARALATVQAAARAPGGDFASLAQRSSALRLGIEQLRNPATSAEAAERLLAYLIEMERAEA